MKELQIDAYLLQEGSQTLAIWRKVGPMVSSHLPLTRKKTYPVTECLGSRLYQRILSEMNRARIVENLL